MPILHFILALGLLIFVARTITRALFGPKSSEDELLDFHARSAFTGLLAVLIAGFLSEVLGFGLKRLSPPLMTLILGVAALGCWAWSRGRAPIQSRVRWTRDFFNQIRAFETPIAAVVVAFIGLEVLFLQTPKAFFDVADSLFYHLPRMFEWYQRGAIEWIDTPGYRLNSFPRLMAVLGATGLAYTDSLRGAIAPSFLIAVLIYAASAWMLARLVLRNQPGVVTPVAGGWIVFGALLSTSPILLQLRAFQTDHVQLAFIAAFIAFRVWEEGPSRVRVLGCLMAMMLSLGNKPTGLPFISIGTILILSDGGMRSLLFSRPKLFAGLVFLCVAVGAIFLAPTLENFYRNGNPLYPFPLKVGPWVFQGGPGWGGEDHIEPGFVNLLKNWKYFFYSVFSIGDFQLIAADVGGYGPGFRILAGPAIIGWIYALTQSRPVRMATLVAFLYCAINMLPRSFGRDGHAEARYFAIMLLPFLLGGVYALNVLLSKAKPIAHVVASGVIALTIFYSFFKVASVPHASLVRDIIGLPQALVAGFREDYSNEPRLRIVALGIGSKIFTGTLYGHLIQHKVRGRGVPVNDLIRVRPHDPIEQVKLCHEDLPQFIQELRDLDLVVFDQFVLPEVRECYRNALQQSGWMFFAESPPERFGLRGVAHYASRPGL